MQICLPNPDRDSGEDVVVESDHKSIRRFLLATGIAWLVHGAWIFRDTLFLMPAVTSLPSHLGIAVWEATAIVLAGYVAWTLFGRRTASFRANALEIHYAIGAFRIGKSRSYSLWDVNHLRMELRGINDRGWKITERSIVFDYRDRTILLFPHVPENAEGSLLRLTRSHALAARHAALNALDLALCASDPGGA